MNQFRRLLIRWEKEAENYFVDCSCAASKSHLDSYLFIERSVFSWERRENTDPLLNQESNTLAKQF